MEDEFDFRRILATFLELRGFDVEGAALVKEALQLIDEHTFDLVLLDLMLPDGRGTDVLDHILADPARRHLPVITMSAIETVQRTELERQLPFLQKPFTISELMATIERLGLQLPAERPRSARR